MRAADGILAAHRIDARDPERNGVKDKLAAHLRPVQGRIAADVIVCEPATYRIA
jgi:hypothetical protein